MACSTGCSRIGRQCLKPRSLVGWQLAEVRLLVRVGNPLWHYYLLLRFAILGSKHPVDLCDHLLRAPNRIGRLLLRLVWVRRSPPRQTPRPDDRGEDGPRGRWGGYPCRKWLHCHLAPSHACLHASPTVWPMREESLLIPAAQPPTSSQDRAWSIGLGEASSFDLDAAGALVGGLMARMGSGSQMLRRAARDAA